MANLAAMYHDQGRWKEAKELEIQVKETSARVLGEEHPDMLLSMNNLVVTCQGQARWKDAEELTIQARKTIASVLEEEHPDTLNCMTNLAAVARSRRATATSKRDKCENIRRRASRDAE